MVKIRSVLDEMLLLLLLSEFPDIEVYGKGNQPGETDLDDNFCVWCASKPCLCDKNFIPEKLSKKRKQADDAENQDWKKIRNSQAFPEAVDAEIEPTEVINPENITLLSEKLEPLPHGGGSAENLISEIHKEANLLAKSTPSQSLHQTEEVGVEPVGVQEHVHGKSLEIKA